MAVLASQGWTDREWWVLTGTIVVLLSAVVLAVILRAVRAVGARPRAAARASLDERFARGELGVDEYRERRRRIDGG